MVHVMVFSTYKIERTLERPDQKIVQYHEVVNMTFSYGRNFATIWRRAHAEVVHVGIGVNGPTQNTQKVK